MRQRFYKMSGSGNDFIIFDARFESTAALDTPSAIQALCSRGLGVGADGVVFIEPGEGQGVDFRMRYYNSDGSRADMCGNAALCVTQLAADLGAAPAEGMRFESDSGPLSARVVGGLPEVDLPAAGEVREDAGLALAPGEQRIGFAVAGVPHLVVFCDDVEQIDVIGRGRALRTHEKLRPRGANVNFLARRPDGSWSIRTYERGVEGETLACGTGAMASAILLSVWGESALETTLMTRSGRPVTVRLRQEGDRWWPTLRGEGGLVFTGELAETLATKR